MQHDAAHLDGFDQGVRGERGHHRADLGGPKQRSVRSVRSAGPLGDGGSSGTGHGG